MMELFFCESLYPLDLVFMRFYLCLEVVDLVKKRLLLVQQLGNGLGCRLEEQLLFLAESLLELLRLLLCLLLLLHGRQQVLLNLALLRSELAYLRPH